MKNLLAFAGCLLALPCAGQSVPVPVAPPEAFKAVAPLRPAYEWLPLGAVKPQGWLRQQMTDDLQHGFLGHLDELVPKLVTADDIYGRDRLTAAVKAKDLGASSNNAAWEVQYLWWNSETQSNWWDGFVRTALLTDDPAALARARQHIEHMLATQDADGYLGIYAPDLRYRFTGENGELWAQSTLLRQLLGYYEATRDQRVLRAVERAVAVTMRAYPVQHSAPFGVTQSFGGVEHGLTLTDTFERLYQLTGKAAYRSYAVWLYEDFCRHKLGQDDAQYAHLIDPAYRFTTHGAHTYEHLRAVTLAAYDTGNPALQAALRGYLSKLDTCLSPSGGPIGDEWIGRRRANADQTGYEYCSTQELLDSYGQLLARSGQPSWADRLEWLLFNAGQGARYPDASAIAYLKTDNSYAMTGGLHPEPTSPAKDKQTRYKYSPVHQDAAVCCVPNAGRIYPTYVHEMWLRSPGGLLAALYGPCDLHTTVGRATVHVVEDTPYPFELGGTLTVTVSQPSRFEIALRKPAWASRLRVQAPAGATVREAGDLVRISKQWQANERITFSFETAVQQHTDQQHRRYLSYGPLVYALALPATPVFTKDYPLPGFHDVQLPATPAPYYQLPAGSTFTAGPAPAAASWHHGPTLTGTLWNAERHAPEPVQLVPMGGTALRQVTFAPQP